MSAEPHLQCAEPSCQFGDNPLGQRVCVQCEAPLPYRYLWAVGDRAATIAVGAIVGDRYYVTAPHVWLDLRPGTPPSFQPSLPPIAQPYLQAQAAPLHLPSLYDLWLGADGVTPATESESATAEPGESAAIATTPILLLDNQPLGLRGELRPRLIDQWTTVPAVRQAYWLWQLLDIWQILVELNLTASLRDPDNLRVDGWRVRLQALYEDDPVSPVSTTSGTGVSQTMTLGELGQLWQDWVPQAQAPIAQGLTELCEQMQTEAVSLEQVKRQLNALMLAQAAQLSLRLTVSGATDPGLARSQNEDSCYPDTAELKQVPPNDPSRVPQLAIVCDGIGGHEGGEVASQLVVRSLRPQMQALLKEVAEQPDIVSPDTIISQIEAAIRVANNLVEFQNTSQNRAERQRMGTTLVLALMIPQQVKTATGWGQAHELYLAQVGDSRAYWLTPDHCHALTGDDVIAAREAIAGRQLYRTALATPTGQALTQALGTRGAEFVTPHIQRFLIEEDGVLLLCSDGLSDGDRVEQSWQKFIALIMREMVPLESVVASWLDLANQTNGHDNIAIVLMQCQTDPILPEPQYQQTTASATSTDPESELTEASRALLYGEGDAEFARPDTPAAVATENSPRQLSTMLQRVLIVLVLIAAVSGLAWWQLTRSSQPPESPEPTNSTEQSN